jgi:hypothetical protein
MYEGLDSAILKNVCDEPILLSTSPHYPGSTIGIQIQPEECVRVKRDPQRVVHRHEDDIKYTIYFFELLDGTGWIHNFDYYDPSKPRVELVCGIPVEDIMHAASTYGISEIAHSYANRVIHYGCVSAKFYIYYMTGTVVVCLPHPRMGETQFFHHNQTLRDLCDIFANPRSAANCVVNETVSQFHSPIRKKTASMRRNADSQPLRENDSTLLSESKALLHQISLLDKECHALVEEKQQLVRALESLAVLDEGESDRKRWQRGLQQAAREERAHQHIQEALDAKRIRANNKLAKQRAHRGQLICCHSSNSEFLQHRWTIDVCSIAMGDVCILLVYDDGSWAACSTHLMPPLMHAELPLDLYDDRLSPVCHTPLLTLATLGSHDRCFLKFADGTCVWHASQAFAQHIQSNNSSVRLVSFGDAWESYFVLFEDKSYCWSNLPPGLVAHLDARVPLEIEAVSLGKAGEWFLRLADGRCYWGNLTKRCIATVGKYKPKMTTVHLGMDEGAFILRYK